MVRFLIWELLTVRCLFSSFFFLFLFFANLGKEKGLAFLDLTAELCRSFSTMTSSPIIIGLLFWCPKGNAARNSQLSFSRAGFDKLWPTDQMSGGHSHTHLSAYYLQLLLYWNCWIKCCNTVGIFHKPNLFITWPLVERACHRLLWTASVHPHSHMSSCSLLPLDLLVGLILSPGHLSNLKPLFTVSCDLPLSRFTFFNFKDFLTESGKFAE